VSEGHIERVERLRVGDETMGLREAELRQELGEKAAARLQVARYAQDPRHREPGADFAGPSDEYGNPLDEQAQG
jgi:hypothetical protein